MAPAPRRRNMIGHRWRVEDQVDDDGRVDGSPSHSPDDAVIDDGPLANNKQGAVKANGSSNLGTPSIAPATTKNALSNGSAQSPPAKSNHDSDSNHVALSAAKASDSLKQLQQPQTRDTAAPSPPKSPSAPVIVSSASAAYPVAPAPGPGLGPGPGPNVRRRTTTDDMYENRRAQDPAHVPNRGAFFMHDSRHSAVPPRGSLVHSFGRGRARGGRAGFVANTYGRVNSLYPPNDPTTNSPWTHDMHDALSRPPHLQRPRHLPDFEGPPNGNGYIPTCKQSTIPINRTLSTEKHIGNAQVRVYLPHMKDAIILPGIHVKQYTKLPDHRPPLRRDKPVRISLPERAPRYIYPASDRSFNFIPRALRPNQPQRGRGGKSRSTFGSLGGFSRRTSILGGSYYGSMYSPSLNLSRRSSIIHDREFMFSPTGSAISRAAAHVNDHRPVVRLPPPPRMGIMMPDIPAAHFGPVMTVQHDLAALDVLQAYPRSDVGKMEPPPPPPPPVVVSQLVDGQTTAPVLPMHQPKPQKNVSLDYIEQPNIAQGTLTQPYQQQAFHQQVPVQMAASYHGDGHSRRPSHHSQQQHVTGTALAHIPERMPPTVPYNNNHLAGYPQPGYYQTQPQPSPASQGYYYHQGGSSSSGGGGSGYAGGGMNAAANGYPSTAPSPLAGNYVVHSQMDQPMTQPQPVTAPGSNNLVAQEVNGMVYYFDPSQLPPPATYPPFASTQDDVTNSMAMAGMHHHGMITPNPGALYYPQTASGMVYFPQ